MINKDGIGGIYILMMIIIYIHSNTRANKKVDLNNWIS